MQVLYWFLVFLGACNGVRYLDEPFFHPCPGMDMGCIRNFFTQHSGCYPTFGTWPDIYYTDQLIIPIPHANVTFNWIDPYVAGLNKGRIEKFYINRQTNKLVIETIWYDAVEACSPNVTIKYHFRGREPFELTDYIRIEYKMVSLTITIPFDAVNGIRWSDRDVYTFYMSPEFIYSFGHNITNAEPEVQTAAHKLMNNEFYTFKEGSIVKSPQYFDLYFNNNICRFYE